MKKITTPEEPLLDEEDIKIEKGVLDPPEEDLFYPKGLLNIISMVFKNKKYQRPRGKKSPTFTIEEIKAIVEFIFFKPPNIIIKVYERMPREKDWPMRRKAFLNHYLGDAKFNAAKAARMAGYSPRSAKQIAYKIKQT
jgi:hypothetical protein